MEMTRETALALARSLTFRHFSHYDFNAYAGVNSPLPMIADNEEYTLVLDGNVLEVTENETGDWETFDLSE